MRDTITLVGTIGTVPALQTSDDGRPFLNFRLATNHSWQSKETHEFVEGDPNWFTVKAFRSLAVNTHASVSKGQRIIVTGRLSVRKWENGEKSGTQVEVMADHIGHDLALGTARYSRMSVPDASRGASTGDGLGSTTNGGTVQEGEAAPADADASGSAAAGESVPDLSGHEVVSDPDEPANAPF
ncbi:single-stranded DNA-binding protein [Spelaeicoccus albus]|uniref:Single-stranded DNA-binding protein n=1 Tax=Spelaeicoccus albus TaxID=1280376 RepID=A0A7Z0D4X3_9MICO|nr:single-stranded DNA-binding protein [Spelaeicoccus albus]NYI68942.1 single-strand DNA-binding protein [Spelaeicoccus albus]